MKQPPIAPAPAAPAPTAMEYAYVDPETSEMTFTQTLGSAPVTSTDPDQLTQECQDIVNRLRSESGNISDNDDQNPDSPEALDEDNIMEEKMRTPPKAPEKPVEEERKPLPNPKDPIALFERKIESLITQSVENKSFQCKVCHMEYARRSHMVEHVETHIEGFMFACNSCSETFPNRPRLRKHKPKCPGLA